MSDYDDDDLTDSLIRRRERKAKARQRRIWTVVGIAVVFSGVFAALIIGIRAKRHGEDSNGSGEALRLPASKDANGREGAAEELNVTQLHQLTTEYRANVFAADKRYKGRRFRFKLDDARNGAFIQGVLNVPGDNRQYREAFFIESISRDTKSGMPYFTSNILNGSCFVWSFSTAELPGISEAQPKGGCVIEGECAGRYDQLHASVKSADFYILVSSCTIIPRR